MDFYEKKLHKHQFVKLIWGLGQINIIDSHFYDSIAATILSPKSKNSNVKLLNVKDI